MTRVNRDSFRILEHPGRMQPFTVWRGHEAHHFDETRESAEAYIAARLEWERQWFVAAA